MSKPLQVRISEGVSTRLHIAATLRKVRPGALVEAALDASLPSREEIAAQLSGAQQMEATDATA
jgi:hypothetical protein